MPLTNARDMSRAVIDLTQLNDAQKTQLGQCLFD